MSPITTHVLDTALGRPACGVGVTLERIAGDGSIEEVGRGTTDADGRVRDLLAQGELAQGTYRLTFDVETYLRQSDRRGFFSRVPIEFNIDDPNQHYHVPLLLSPFGYSTYRGS
jgi:5-hydroxyisourate hydrolase